MSEAEEFPSRLGFARLIDKIRSQHKAGRKWKIAKTLLDDVPLDLLLNQIEAGYFVEEGSLDEVDNCDALVSKEWNKVTKGKEDPYSRLTIFMCIACGAKIKTAIPDTEARTMIRHVREHGFDSDALTAFIASAAPVEVKDNLRSLWQGECLPEAEEYLDDDSDPKYTRALQFLKENCNIKSKSVVK